MRLFKPASLGVFNMDIWPVALGTVSISRAIQFYSIFAYNIVTKYLLLSIGLEWTLALDDSGPYTDVHGGRIGSTGCGMNNEHEQDSSHPTSNRGLL